MVTPASLDQMFGNTSICWSLHRVTMVLFVPVGFVNYAGTANAVPILWETQPAIPTGLHGVTHEPPCC